MDHASLEFLQLLCAWSPTACGDRRESSAGASCRARGREQRFGVAFFRLATKLQLPLPWSRRAGKLFASS